ncbi:Ankyrin repeat domain-containing protein [Mycena sanguinolenta]|uniref:Ankyrin repeat domain-containing protein n=1 Tax=Mycena sanguinolenta TaxID=230812 RepID=A0A8H7CJ11_9AGAR|nr:Ankyrin repeat domain-containing protein [Mycena sanguinolenta]
MLAELPPELILQIMSFLTRLPGNYHLAVGILKKQELIPDLPSINALSQTNTALHQTLNQVLYDLCASVDPLGGQTLVFAVVHELGTTLDKCVAAGISLDTEFIFGPPRRPRSLLHVAAALGTREMVVKLLNMYGEGMIARVHAWGSSLTGTALDCAVRNGHLEIVRLLAPIPVPTSNACPKISPSLWVQLETHEQYLNHALQNSVETGNLEISRYLLTQGADVNFCDYRGTLLNKAVLSQNLELVQFLLASGADPDRNYRGLQVPLFSAVNNGSVELIEALLAAGANPHAEDNAYLLKVIGDVKLLRLFLERRVDPNHRDKWGRTPLHYACLLSEDDACVELLLQFGAVTTEVADNDGNTPVSLAMARNRSQVVKMLMKGTQSILVCTRDRETG